MRVFISEQPALATSTKVFVNGEDVSARCYGADDELGEAHCYVMSDKGLTATEHSHECQANRRECTLGEDKADGCHLVREILKGNVRIELPNA